MHRLTVTRYADDMVFTFESVQEAERFSRVLPKRLAKYGLAMNMEKSSFQPGGRTTIESKKVPKPRFKFLGFEIRWIRGRNGRMRPAYTPRLDRMNQRIRDVRHYLWQNRHTPNHMRTLAKVARVVKGWVNYFAISDCTARVRAFINAIKQLIHKWLNSRGGNRYTNWSTTQRVLREVGITEKFQIRPMY
jgi:hypothetical protein